MYKVEIFSDQFIYKSMAMVDETTTAIEQDFLTYDSNTIQTPLIDCEKGDLIHITDQDNNYVADGIIADVQPGNKAQEITIRPLNALFDTEVFYTAVTDCITWLATNIDNAFMSNTDTLQNRPITLTYTQSADALPLTGFNLHETVNILSVMVSAMKTYGVVVASRLDLPNKRFTVNIYQQTATKTLEASLENVLQKSVTIGDSYGSTNKAIIRKIRVVDDVTTVLGQTEFYLHPNGTIDTTDGNRIVPVFWELESLELDDDMTESEWQAAALSRAKEILTPAKYDNEIVLQYDRDDLLARPADLLIGTATTIYLDGNTYASILTGKRIEGQKITLIFGVTRTELTKQISIKQRETLTYQNTVSAINKIVEKRIAGGGGGGGGSSVKYFLNKTVSSWVSDSTYTLYPYKGFVSIPGVSSADGGEVSYSTADADSGNYSPICQTTTDGVYIWAKTQQAVTIPTIAIAVNSDIDLQGEAPYLSTEHGGTVNGDVTFNDIVYSHRDGASLVSDQQGIDTSTTPTSDKWKNVVLMRDKNGEAMGNLMAFHRTDGRVGVHFEAERLVNGTRKSHAIRVELDSSGNPIITGNASAWLTFMGLVPSSVSASYTSNVSGAGSYNRYYKFGRLVVLNFNLSLKAVTAANTAYITGLPTPYGGAVGFSLARTGSANRFYISTDGEMRNDDTSITAAWYNGSVVYIST